MLQPFKLRNWLLISYPSNSLLNRNGDFDSMAQNTCRRAILLLEPLVDLVHCVVGLSDHVVGDPIDGVVKLIQGIVCLLQGDLTEVIQVLNGLVCCISGNLAGLRHFIRSFWNLLGRNCKTSDENVLHFYSLTCSRNSHGPPNDLWPSSWQQIYHTGSSFLSLNFMFDICFHRKILLPQFYPGWLKWKLAAFKQIIHQSVLCVKVL